MEVTTSSTSGQLDIKNEGDPWEFLEKELQEFEKAMKALEEGEWMKTLSIIALDLL